MHSVHIHTHSFWACPRKLCHSHGAKAWESWLWLCWCPQYTVSTTHIHWDLISSGLPPRLTQIHTSFIQLTNCGVVGSFTWQSIVWLHPVFQHCEICVMAPNNCGSRSRNIMVVPVLFGRHLVPRVWHQFSSFTPLSSWAGHICFSGTFIVFDISVSRWFYKLWKGGELHSVGKRCCIFPPNTYDGKVGNLTGCMCDPDSKSCRRLTVSCSSEFSHGVDSGNARWPRLNAERHRSKASLKFYKTLGFFFLTEIKQSRILKNSLKTIKYLN